MTWADLLDYVAIGLIAWMVVGLGVALLIGRSIKVADRREEEARQEAREETSVEG